MKEKYGTWFKKIRFKEIDNLDLSTFSKLKKKRK